MDIQITARHFRAREEVKQHARDAVGKLARFYDGIVSADVILSYERTVNSVKTAEINLHVYGTTLTGKGKSEEYSKSIEMAIVKLEVQLEKYKARMRSKDKKKVRKLKNKV